MAGTMVSSFYYHCPCIIVIIIIIIIIIAEMNGEVCLFDYIYIKFRKIIELYQIEQFQDDSGHLPRIK